MKTLDGKVYRVCTMCIHGNTVPLSSMKSIDTLAKYPLVAAKRFMPEGSINPRAFKIEEVTGEWLRGANCLELFEISTGRFLWFTWD